ncbi:hypothetical protein BX666DRAFT_2031715 [Dichotomocladium elegans]|nr:hypothetical protein BX666DRAFT_2031715 [Dichotomocladium elegans]
MQSSRPINAGANMVNAQPDTSNDAAVISYRDLYSPDPIDGDALNTMLSAIPTHLPISSEHKVAFPGEFSIEDLQTWYANTHFFQDLVVEVYNAAMNGSQCFPASWLELCVSPLPKKSDLSSLKN